MDDYTPTTLEVRESYTYFRGTIPTVEHAAEFDRWLAEHDREVAEKAWDEGYDYATNGKWGPGENPYDEED